MTKKEFIAQRVAAKRIDNRFALVALAISFVGALGTLIAAQFQSHLVWGDPLVYGLGLLLLLWTIGCIIIVIFSGRVCRKQLYLCLACGKPIDGVVTMIAVASNHCGHCGAAVFDPPKA